MKAFPLRKQYSAPALERGLMVLETLARVKRPMTLKDLTFELGQTSGELYRILQLLIARGYLERADEDRAYILAAKQLGSTGDQTNGNEFPG